MNDIAALLELIATGINPTTGEIFETEVLRDDPAIKGAIYNLLRAYMNENTMPSYAKFEKRYPGYVILQKCGYFYTAYNNSADILSVVLDYKLGIDAFGRRTTGGPDIEKIANHLAKAEVPFIVVIKGEVACIFDENHPLYVDAITKIAAKKRRKTKLLELSAEQLRHFEYSFKRPISISEVARRLMALKTDAQEGKITYKDIARWLHTNGFLEEGTSEQDRLKRRPTMLGLSKGISCEDRMSANGPYKVVVYDAKGQKFIVDHYQAIVHQYGHSE